MRLRTWLEQRGIDADKGLCVTVASDGFGKKDHTISISVMPTDIDQNEALTHYIEGAPEEGVQKVMEYTGVPYAVYREKALGKPRAAELLTEAIAGKQFLVMYTALRYTQEWLHREFADHAISKLPTFDVILAVKTIEVRRPLPDEVDSLERLQMVWQDATFYLKKGYAFEEVVARYVGSLPELTALPELEKKVIKLKRLWVALLTMEF